MGGGGDDADGGAFEQEGRAAMPTRTQQQDDPILPPRSSVASAAAADDSEDEKPLPPPFSASSAAAAFQSTLGWNIESCSVGRGKKRKAILRDIVGESHGGELTAIMGASGAGKTSLLECISLRSRQFRGAVHLNGRPARPSYFTQSALVYQHEVMCEFLTVEEHLLFQGTARMANRYGPQDIARRIDQVIAEMGLGKCRHTLVGGPNAKGLSGGERKRLGIATELLLCSAILFLDEPTTSVDSVMAESIVALLRRLAGSRGLTVLATIHSPSSQLFAYFSRLLLLTADGRLAFHGAVPDALSHFASLGKPLPAAYNPADHLIKLVVRRPRNTSTTTKGSSQGSSSSQRQSRQAEREQGNNDALVNAFRGSPYWCRTAPAYSGRDAHRRLRGVQGQQASALALFRLNLWRGWLQTARNPLGFWLYGAVMAIIGLVFGVLYFQQGASNWRNFVGLMYALTVALLFMCPLTVILRTPLEWPMLLREYFAGANAAGPYLAAKSLSELPFAYAPMLLVTILYWMTGLEPGWDDFLKFGGVVVLTTQAACALALMVASFSANALLTLALLPAFITPMVLFSGFLYDTATLPPYLAWLPRVSIVSYAFSSLVTLQQGLLPADVRPMVLKFANVDPTALQQSVLRLLAMMAGCYFVAYVSLALRLRTAKRA